MKAHRWFQLTSVAVVSLLLISGIGGVDSQAAQFSADMVQSVDLMITTGRIHVSDARYRMDLQTPFGPDVVVIVDQTSGLTRVLVPKYKMFIEIPNTDPLSLMNDPFQAAEAMLAQYSLEEAGSETIAEYSCAKQLIHFKNDYSESRIMNRWICEKLGFPLKLEMLIQEDTFTELSGIREESIAESLFQIPSGFEKTTWENISGQMETDSDLDAKMETFEKTRLVKTKVRARMSAEHEVSVLIREGVEVRIKAESAFEKPFGFHAIPYRGGKALKKAAACTYSEPISFTLAEELHPDLIVTGTEAGNTANLELTFVGQRPVILAKREEYFTTGRKTWSINEPYEKLTIRFTADLEEGSRSQNVSGKLDVSSGGWSERKTDSFEFELTDGQSKSYELSIEDDVTELSYSIITGRVKVRYIMDNRTGALEPPPFPEKP
jgi:hypothetical protein